VTPTELRAVLLERLPADPKWVTWVEGVLERVGTVEDPRIARIAALCDEIDREAEEDPNGGFGPGMQAVAREVRALLKEASS